MERKKVENSNNFISYFPFFVQRKSDYSHEKETWTISIVVIVTHWSIFIISNWHKHVQQSSLNEKNGDNTCYESFSAMLASVSWYFKLHTQLHSTHWQHFILNCFFLSQRRQSIAWALGQRAVVRMSTGMIFNRCEQQCMQ